MNHLRDILCIHDEQQNEDSLNLEIKIEDLINNLLGANIF